MDVILHLGAHRTGTTTLQRYLAQHRGVLAAQGLGYWGPQRTRGGLLSGLVPAACDPPGLKRRALGRVRMNVADAQREGLQRLIVSDENILGGMRGALLGRALYPEAERRLSCIAPGFTGLRRVVINIRALDCWWASVLAHAVARGHPVPGRAALERLVTSPRSWRHVIEDVAGICGDAEICVTTFEDMAGRPDRLAQVLAGTAALMPPDRAREWHNRGRRLPQLRAALDGRPDAHRLPGGEGRWMPFSPDMALALQQKYAADLAWLRAGADGLATLTEETPRGQDGPNPPPPPTRGHAYDHQERGMVGAR